MTMSSNTRRERLGTAMSQDTQEAGSVAIRDMTVSEAFQPLPHPVAIASYTEFIGLEMTASEEMGRQRIFRWGAGMQVLLSQGVPLDRAASQTKPGFFNIEEEVAALRWLERIWLYNASPLLQEALARQHAAVVRRNQALVTQNLG